VGESVLTDAYGGIQHLATGAEQIKLRSRDEHFATQAVLADAKLNATKAIVAERLAAALMEYSDPLDWEPAAAALTAWRDLSDGNFKIGSGEAAA
jgi:hypothetical protein